MTNTSAIDRLIQDLRAANVAILASPRYGEIDLNQAGAHGRTALMAVAAEGLVVAAEALVQAGASVNATGRRQMTPLHEAAATGQTEMAQFLLTRGARVDAATDQGVTPLMCAAAWGNTSIVSLLLEAGADWTRTDVVGATAADIAREKGEDGAAELIEAHAGRQAKPYSRSAPQ